MSTLKNIVNALRQNDSKENTKESCKSELVHMTSELSEHTKNLDKLKVELTNEMANDMQVLRKISSLEQEIKTQESYAKEALTNKNNQLALDLADIIVKYEIEKQSLINVKDKYNDRIISLKKDIEEIASTINNIERQLSMMATAESINKATHAIADNYRDTNTKLLSAKNAFSQFDKNEVDNKGSLKDSHDNDVHSSDLSAQLVLERIKTDD